jgi:coenzyme F420-0:L-glutamate ligase/coenzyme F420-1:gamma-L-glutamate ligase
MDLLIKALDNFPEIWAGDSISDIIFRVSQENDWIWQNGDAVVIAQKIISKSENRYKNLTDIKPGKLALQYSETVDKDPRLIELILSESKKVLRTRNGLMIVQHKLGFVCANAGIDHSNVIMKDGSNENWVLLLPEEPDKSARLIQEELKKLTNVRLGILIIDSHGRAWRKGVVGTTIGISQVPGVVDKRGDSDRYGYKLRITEIGAADELAAAASLMMGQADEGRPVVLAKGFPYHLRNSETQELIRSESDDLFR